MLTVSATDGEKQTPPHTVEQTETLFALTKIFAILLQTPAWRIWKAARYELVNDGACTRDVEDAVPYSR